MSMKVAVRLISASALTLSLVFAGASAAPAAEATADAARALDRLSGGKAGSWSAEWSGSGTNIRRLEGGPKLATSDVAAAAAAFLEDGKDVFGLDGFTLAAPLSRRGHRNTHLTFRKAYRGLPVFNAVIDVHVRPSGDVGLVTSNSRSANAPKAAVSTVPAISAATAGERARTVLAGTVLRDKAGAPRTAPTPAAGPCELGFFETDTGERLAWRVSLGPAEVTIDATTGAALATRILRQAATATGSGRAFDPNPIYTLNNAGLRDNGNQTYAALAPAYRSVKLNAIRKTVTGGGTSYALSGPYVKLMDIGAANLPNTCIDGSVEVRQAPPVPSRTTFNYNRSQSGFEHTMVYFIIDRNQRYIQSLGFDDLMNRPIRVDAHAIAEDNSFYCSIPVGAGYIVFGNGGVDDAEDADVVLHEYGHALQDAASLGRYAYDGETGAMGEGFGDYWAYSTYHAGRWADCFAEWDGQGKCLRRLDRGKVYPGSLVNEVHADGEIWSRGLRDLLKAIGKTRTDTIVLESHYLVPELPQFADGLAALVAADAEIYAGRNRSAICRVFKARGITTTSCN